MGPQCHFCFSLSSAQMKLPISPSNNFTSWRPPPHLNVRINLVPWRISHRNASSASVRASARDRVIDFGKYKGRMLGSLPSAYLKWVSSNLRAGDTEEWARLADRVLADPVYADRLEWEAAEKILTGNAATTSSSGRTAVTELLEISHRFGWDNEDKSGWSKIDFALLGTSKGARIPRAPPRASGVGCLEEPRNESSGGGKRGERRERVRRLRERTTSTRTSEEERESSSPTAGGASAGSPFPGREALLKKVLNRQKL